MGGQDSVVIRRPHCNDKDVGSNPPCTEGALMVQQDLSGRLVMLKLSARPVEKLDGFFFFFFFFFRFLSRRSSAIMSWSSNDVLLDHLGHLLCRGSSQCPFSLYR